MSDLFPMHGLPPLAGGGSLHVRVLVHMPLLHDVLQGLQADQVPHCPSTEIYMTKCSIFSDRHY